MKYIVNGYKCRKILVYEKHDGIGERHHSIWSVQIVCLGNGQHYGHCGSCYFSGFCLFSDPLGLIFPTCYRNSGSLSALPILVRSSLNFPSVVVAHLLYLSISIWNCEVISLFLAPFTWFGLLRLLRKV